MLVFDCETNGLLNELDRIHCLVIHDTKTHETYRYRHNDWEQTIAIGLKMLMHATECGTQIVGFNNIGFDEEALRKVYPWFQPKKGMSVDTMVLACLLWPDPFAMDTKLFKKGKLPGNLRGRHSLEAWGHRLGEYKGEYTGDPEILDEEERKKRKWEKWSVAMEDYCEQDVMVTVKLLAQCQASVARRGFSDESMRLEHEVKTIVSRQERRGVAFDVEAAEALQLILVKEQLKLTQSLVQAFGSFYVGQGVTTPLKPRRSQCEELGLASHTKKGVPQYKTMDYTAGAPYTKLQLNVFNPGSRDHVANRLKHLFQWEPVDFTGDGKPKVDEAVLSQLDYPGIEDLKRLFMVSKRLGQIADGKEAWLKHVKHGRIHGRVHTNKAVTGRMAHSGPNLGQVPASSSPFGEECRACFIAPRGMVLVGADADALELRDLAGYMARYDGGAYIRTILEGRKEDGTDMHSVNCRALGMDPKKVYFDGTTGRDIAKTYFYAFIYGAGDEKLGAILSHKKGQSAAAVGMRARRAFMKNLPALGKLMEAVLEKVDKTKTLRGLDGRILDVRSKHSALNTLLQSAGAIQMKRALVILDNRLQELGLIPGVDYEFVLNVHDEWQIETYPQHGDLIGKEACDAIKAAGEYYSFKCPLAGNYKIGKNWAETH